MTTKKGFNDQVSFATYDKIAIPEEFKGLSFIPEGIQALASIYNTLVDFAAKETAKENENLKTLNEQVWQAYNKETDLQTEILRNNDLPPELKKHCFDRTQESKDSKKEMNDNREANANSNKRYLIWVVGGITASFFGGLALGRLQKNSSNRANTLCSSGVPLYTDE